MNNNTKVNFLEKIKQYSKKYYWIFIIVLILISITTGYKMGYRIKNNLTIGKIGKVVIEIPFPNTSVYIDQSKKIITSKDNENIEINLSPKKHSVIISREGMYPWTKEFTVPSGGHITLSPIFVYLNVSGQMITEKDPEYYKIRNSVVYAKTPTESSPIISKDGKVKIWMNDNAIIARIADNEKDVDKTYKVIQPDTVIRNVDFYKDRSDSLMFSTSNGVYVIEIKSEGTQNFMPLYKGVKPSFLKINENSIYVLDESNLMQIII